MLIVFGLEIRRESVKSCNVYSRGEWGQTLPLNHWSDGGEGPVLVLCVLLPNLKPVSVHFCGVFKGGKLPSKED